MTKTEIIDAIFVELAAKHLVQIDVDVLNPSYLDYYSCHTLQRNADSSYSLETRQSDNDAGSIPTTLNQTLTRARLENWLEQIDETDLAKASARDDSRALFRKIVSEKKAG